LSQSRAWIAAIILFLINLWIAFRFLVVEHHDQMASIEAAYLAIARYAAQHPGGFTWFPLWYGGIPYQNSYPPVFHWLVALVLWITNAPLGHVFHAVSTIVYCLGPVTLFLLMRRLSRSLTASVLGALMYSCLAPSAWLITNVRADVQGPWGGRRLHTLTIYGEQPHLMGLLLLPLALWALDRVREQRSAVRWFWAAGLIAATCLSNWLAAFALALAIVAYALTRPVAQWGPIAIISLLAGGFAAPWVVPSTLVTIQRNARTIGGDFQHIFAQGRWRYALAALLLAALVWALRRMAAPPLVQLGLLFTFFMGGITLTSEWGGVALMPQPNRYHVEMEMALALAAAGLFAWLGPARRRLQAVLALAALAACVYGAVHIHRQTRRWVKPIDITQTVEWKVARWLDEHAPNQRVFVPGSISYWLNAFVDQHQWGGGFDQGVENPNVRVGHYIVYSGDGAGERDAEISLLWLKAFGVQIVGTGGPQSREAYKPFRNARKFDGRLEELWREGDDALYRVPQRSVSVARVVRRDALPTRAPINGIDIAPLEPYVASLDDATLPLAQHVWHRPDELHIRVPLLGPGQVISVQVTGSDGWETARGRLWRDGLGQLVLEPACQNCIVRLNWTGGTERRVAVALAWLTAGWFAVWWWRTRRV
jgi:hypothetical protein